MKHLVCAIAAVATVVSVLPADAANHAGKGRHRAVAEDTVLSTLFNAFGNSFDEGYVGSGGRGDGPNWQGSLTDNLPIWRHGYYQGNDPDQFIRGQLMRDPRNGAHK